MFCFVFFSFLFFCVFYNIFVVVFFLSVGCAWAPTANNCYLDKRKKNHLIFAKPETLLFWGKKFNNNLFKIQVNLNITLIPSRQKLKFGGSYLIYFKIYSQLPSPFIHGSVPSWMKYAKCIKLRLIAVSLFL